MDGAIDEQLKGSPSPSPTYALPSDSPSPASDATGTGLTSGSGSGSGSGTSVSEPTVEETPNGCVRGNQVIRSNLDTYGKANAASLSSLAVNLHAPDAAP
ncbi:hypothetical protein [Streptomyces sioyaensis]|uniref:hypothetical protein n=1 Tax=Streptomyces sioyaensis TaxID=67364 RepID=UPI0037AA5C1F